MQNHNFITVVGTQHYYEPIMFQVCGAPDPTAGASANEQTSWYLDDKTLHDNIKKILIKFCVPAPIVFR